mmetsp:Transcript_8973/g.17369  ORF Transcript_8973/g.17369 Transcript_8973/m.17369 type:complete len:742 (-) Transcript_8973:224-2449(-)
MLEISTSFTLPPVIRRIGRCGQGEQERMPLDDAGISSERSAGETRHKECHHPSLHRGAETGTERVKTFVNGIVSPFTACWRPSIDSCASGCEQPEHAFEKQPALVSPSADRVISHRDGTTEHEQDYYSRCHPRYHQRSLAPNNYHPPAVFARTSASPRRREGGVESEVVNDSPPTTTFHEKKRRNTDISKPRPSDILCGRGGSSNRHMGNIQFRELVAANKQIYVGLTKKQKMLVARKIVDAIHSTGGRFLAKDMDTGLFYDIGLPRSLEKTSQALREKHSNEIPLQPLESEGIETSVESYHSVVKMENENDTNADADADTNTNTNDSKQTAGESTVGTSSSSRSSSKTSTKTQAPSLSIPPHLMKLFGPKKSNTNEKDRENCHQQHTISPMKYSGSDQPYDSYHYNYPPSPYIMPPGSFPSHFHRKGYPPVPGHPSAPAGHPHHSPYPASPIPAHAHYRSHPHYYYQGHPPQTPPHGWRGGVPDGRFSYPGYDDREAYSREQQYYAGSVEYEQAGPRLSPPNGKRLPSRALYHRYPTHRLSPHYHAPPLMSQPHSGHGSHGSSLYLPQYRPSHYSRCSYQNDDTPSYLPSQRIVHRKTSNGYVRENSDMSPSRQRELKRQRNGEAFADASLSSAISKSLSLNERVVGREREQQQSRQHQQLQGSNTFDETDSGPPILELTSPSTMLQSCVHTRKNVVDVSARVSPTEKKEDIFTFSGLAALSTAAFLKLDEDDDKKRIPK